MLSFQPVPKPEKPLIRVLIVDDMPQVCEELRVLLQLSNEVEVIGEAGNGREAISQAELLNPDVVIMDLEMPVMDGVEATIQIKQRKLAKRIVILSVHSEAEDIDRAIRAGADAYIQKGSSYTTLMASIQQQNTILGECT
jgi:DNA-binding NarL/FixJ family response regulator